MAEYYIAPKSSFDATADAIREKTGSQATIEWTEDGFADAIEGIPTGNDREDLTVPKDVDFIDFDGRLLYSYTAQEFLALSTLPPNPSYTGLTAQGWNWTLADAKTFVQQYSALVVGQNYTTSDGKTRIYVSVTPQVVQAQLTFEVVATATVKNGLKIYWGDGSESVWNGNANANGSGASHVYTNPGDYVIQIEVLDGEISWLGRTGANSSLLGGNGRVQGCVTRIEIGDNVTGLAQNTFKFMKNLKVLTIPTNVQSLNDYDEGMFSCNWMRGIVFPAGFTTNRYRAMFPNDCTLVYISIPKSMHNFSIGTYPSHLRKLTIESLEPYGGNKNLPKLHSSYNLTHFVVMGTWTTVADDSVRETMIKKLFLPATVTAINGITAFAYNNQLEEVHLYPSTPPTLSNSGSFRDTAANCIFYVPYSADHSILEAYQTATNWSTYASRMQEEPQ